VCIRFVFIAAIRVHSGRIRIVLVPSQMSSASRVRTRRRGEIRSWGLFSLSRNARYSRRKIIFPRGPPRLSPRTSGGAECETERERARERERERERGSRSLSSGCSRLSGSGVTYKSSEKKRGAYRRDCGSTCETCLALRSMRAGDVRLKGEGGG
jgi:hypothetical protein